VFVAAVAQVGTPLTTDYSPAGLARYAFLFMLIWWAWNGHTIFLNRFDSDDLVQRALTLVQMFAVAAMAVNAKDALDSRSSAGFAAAYAAMRFVLVAQYVRARGVPTARNLTTRYAVGYGVAAVLWLVSSVVPVPSRFWLWAAALAIDLGTPLATTRHTLRVPPDTAHLPERFGLFTIILLGESMVAVMKGMEAQDNWSFAAGSSAFLGMCLGLFLWWWYFDGADGASERAIRTRRQATRFQIWSYAHLPLYLGIAVAGVGIEHIIVMATTSHLHAAESWILCAALAVVMASMTTIAATSDEAERHADTWRVMLPHYGLAVITLLTGSIGDRISPTTLVALLTALALLQVILSARLGGAFIVGNPARTTGQDPFHAAVGLSSEGR
jgi:low temperature requirement protein LtrA